MARIMHNKQLLFKKIDFVKGKMITNFSFSKTGKVGFLPWTGSFFKKKVCTTLVKNIHAICTLDHCLCSYFHNFFDIFETDFRRFLNILRFQILKYSQILRLISYEKARKWGDFFMLK